MKKKIGIIFSIILLICLGVGVFFGLKLVQQKQELRKEAATPGGTARISLASVATIGASQPLPVTINFQTPNTPGNKGIIGIKVVLNYTASGGAINAFSNTQIQESLSSPWQYSIKEVAPSGNSGTITINALYLQAGEYGYLGAQDASQNFAVLNFSTATNGSLELNFDITKCEVWSKDGNLDILGLETAGKTISIGSGAGTITNTPTPTPTINPSSAPTSTPAPTNTPTPTPTTSSGGTGGGSLPTNTPTTTRSAISTPTPIASNPNQVTLTSITSGQTVTSTKPTFSGKAPAGSTITITVYSDPITGTVTANSAGVWTWTPPTDLTPGSHSVTITSATTQGQTTTTSASFTIGSLPVTGNFSLTLILLFLGLLIIFPALWIALNKSSVKA